jgi:hypothetical protein
MKSAQSQSRSWQWWFLSGVTGKYIDIDYNFWLIHGYLHIRWNREGVCQNPAHTQR